jgi:hypothetical protein
MVSPKHSPRPGRRAGQVQRGKGQSSIPQRLLQGGVGEWFTVEERWPTISRQARAAARSVPEILSFFMTF